MKSLVVKVLSLLCFVCICFAFASCEDKTEYDNLRDEGSFITVTYNPNGGRILMKKGISYIDMFNPDNIAKDSDGNVRIKLLSLDNPLRSKQDITPTKNGYFCVGWYRTRTPATKIFENEEYVIDESENLLVLNSDEEYVIAYTKQKDGSYVAATGKEKTSTPVYVYSDRWDFDNDEIVYSEGKDGLGIYNGETKETEYTKGDSKYEITLYAAWLKNFTFEYYYEETVGGVTSWVKNGSSSGFDYEAVKAGKASGNELYLPYWNYNEDGEKTGGIVYSEKNDEKQTISKKIGTTFQKAYTDENCTNEITEEKIVHSGTVDYATGTAINGIEKIYVKTTEGEDYYIDTVDQFTDNVSLNGNYYIRNDLTFAKGNEWPTTFTTNEFNGKMISLKDGGVKFSGIDVTVKLTDNGGLFGILGSSAEISGVNFDNINVYFEKLAKKGSYGMFAGTIDEGAKLTDVTLSGSMRLNGETEVSTSGNDKAKINLFANADDLTGITKGDVKLYVCGAKNTAGNYRYNIRLGSVQVDKDGNVTYSRSNVTENHDEAESLEYPKSGD